MISCVLCTYGRMHYVERSVSFFLAQDFQGETELIIFNTDSAHPVTMVDKPDNITIVNNGIDYTTNQPYTNVGAIRADALTHANGEYFITWDDDDIFLPWALRQRYDNILSTGNKAWKSSQSFYMNGVGAVSLQRNTFEAACIIKTAEVSFALETGSEAVGKNGWYIRLRDEGQLNENSVSLPDYGFEWYDHFKLDPHRQSGDINNPSNFEVHKTRSKDYHTRPIQRIDVNPYFQPYFQYLTDNKDALNNEYYSRYFIPYAEKAVL